MKNVLRSGILVLAICFAFAGVTRASPVTGELILTNCGTAMTTCPGATYDFSIGTTSATLSITIGGGNALTTNNNQITGVDLGFLPQNDFTNLNPNVATNFGATWAGSLGSLSNGNCGTNGGAFVCAQFQAGGSPVTVVDGGTYTWTWNYTLTSQGQMDLSSVTSGAVHIGANYGPANGLIVSETGAGPIPTPEPAISTLLGVGLLSVGFLRRRK